MSVFKYKDQTMMGGNNKANKIGYDPTESQLEAENVQAALDEINDKIDSLNSSFETDLSGIVITYNSTDGHFYAKKGNVTKKLGSGEGTASASQVLSGTTFSSNTTDGEVANGTMPNNGAVNVTLDTSTTSYTVPTGYHNGSGTVKITTQSKTVTPTTSSQTVSPDTNKVLSGVTVNAIQTQSKTATPTTSSQTISPDSGKYLSSVTVNAIQTQTKTVYPSTSAQTVTPDSGKYLSSVSVGSVVVSAPSSNNILQGSKVDVLSNGQSIITPINGGISKYVNSIYTTNAKKSGSDILIQIPNTGYYESSYCLSVPISQIISILGAYNAVYFDGTLTLS